jgi:hypothetical protein
MHPQDGRPGALARASALTERSVSGTIMRTSHFVKTRHCSGSRRCWCSFRLRSTASNSRADTVASLLGNFTVNQYSELALGAGKVEVRHAIVFGQLPALRELHLADADGDGVTSQAERDAHAQRLANPSRGSS